MWVSSTVAWIPDAIYMRGNEPIDMDALAGRDCYAGLDSSMSAPTKEFYRLLMEGRIIHGGNPVLRWMAGNVVIDTDPAGNIKVTKAKSKEKIDGIVAAIMALDRCIRQEGQSGSVYDERGLLVF